MTADIATSVQAAMVGFALAGCLASGFELFAARRAGLGLLRAGGLAALAALPILILAAPFVLVRHCVGLKPPGRLTEIAAALALAALWSLMSGWLVMDAALIARGA